MEPSTQTLDINEIHEILSDIRDAIKSGKIGAAKASARLLSSNLPSLKKDCSFFINSLTSIQEGMADRSITKDEARKELSSSVDDLSSKLEKILKKSAKFKEADDFKLGITVPSSPSVDYTSEKTKLEASIESKGLFLGKSSLLPMTNPPLSEISLKDAGLKVDSFSGYVILRDQIVLGVSRDLLNNLVGSTKSEKEFQQKKAEILQKLKEKALNKFPNKKLVDSGLVVSWYESYWFWFMPTGYSKIFKQSTISPVEVSTFSLKKWSFPW